MTRLTLAQLSPMLPELLLAVGALVLVLIGAFRGERSSRGVNGIAIVLLLIAAVAAYTAPAGTLFGGSFVMDGFGRFLKVTMLIGALASMIMSLHWFKAEGVDRFEYAILVVLSATGMMMMISANDLIALYLGFELQSLPLYVIAAIHRDNLRSTEAGLKYFVLGALSSGMLLYGCSLVYGFAGTVSFPGIADAVKAGASTGLIFGLVFVFAGLAFKVSAVPFHMWTPDVYEGAPTPVTNFFAVAPKVAAMAVFLRVANEAFPGIAGEWRQIVVFLAIASMFLGSFAGIGQRNIKRLMAYSSIGNVGYMLVGLAAGTAAGVQGVLIYLVIYLAMTLGSFACILAMRRGGQAVETIDDLAGLARTRPAMGFVLAMIMFSLMGIPPLAGFWAKWYVFVAAVQAGLYPLAVLGVVASVIGGYYYLRIVKVIYLDEPKGAFEPMPAEIKAVLALSGAFVLLYVLYPSPLVAAAEAAAKSLF